ncbi:enoyl-CoA hydratase/isomerase family protein [Desulforhopalus singaporensis]|uniref:Enoyl-CoA hydratase n=1 Tax=Desulforhopalus singaporensis TaxID=91360 RepID=A0A1H0IUA8_9BACT|nr:enoyl-CoA hydratase-related protein [Desulforhopalus singaporensis]SDO35084.1 enoyl-CoA hydratase [Desulforhopalus singaporensis]
MAYENIIFEKEDNIAVVTFNRPEAMNALNNQTRAEFGEAVREVEADDDIRVLILTGSGKAFVAGSDIKEFHATTPYAAHNIVRLGSIVEKLAKPVIAAVNGFCLGGGCEIAMGCDLIIASEKAKFGQPEINLGIIPGGGGTQRLQRLVGMCRAKELIFTGDIIRAEEAERIGLVNRVVAMDELMPTAREVAAKIAVKSPAALKLAKQAINKGAQMSLQDGLDYEYEMYALALSLEDKAEGVNAFLEKRAAKFVGR